ncbi:MAG: hypothetical protein ACK5X3_20420, partial [Pseudomonadota bacterium]
MMTRRRCGVAGFFDRNKGWLKPAATIGAGLLTGGMGGAVVGGLMRGLDREGKGGIGFDVGQGVRGAVQGYGLGKGAGMLKSGIMSRLGGQAASSAVGAATPAVASPVTAAATAAPGGLSPVASSGFSFTDPKTLMALGQTAVGGLNAFQNNQQMQMQRQEQERRNRLEDEQVRRRQAMDPMRSALMAALFQRLGMGNAPQAGGAA